MNQVLLMGRLAEQFRTDESGLRTVMKLEIVRDDDNSVNSEACIIPVLLWRGLGDILQAGHAYPSLKTTVMQFCIYYIA